MTKPFADTEMSYGEAAPTQVASGSTFHVSPPGYNLGRMEHASFFAPLWRMVSFGPSCTSPAEWASLVANGPDNVTTQVFKDHERLRATRDRRFSRVERRNMVDAYAKPILAPRWQRATVFTNWILAGLTCVSMAVQMARNPKSAILAILLAPVALYVADFGAQCFHKWLDSYASERNVIWGTTAQVFRKHHEVPDNLNDEPLVNNITPASVMLTPFFAGTAMASSLELISLAASSSALLFLMSVLHTTEFHKQAHTPKPRPVFSFLQKLRLALPHDVHMVHHRPPFDKDFAVFLGWSNHLVRKINLWVKIDKLFWKYTGRMPHNWVQDPRAIPDVVVGQIQQDLHNTQGPAGMTFDDAVDIMTYQDTYVTRTNGGLKPAVLDAIGRWQKDFFAKRGAIFRTMAQNDRARAEAEWRKEQMEFPWLYNGTVKELWDAVEPGSGTPSG